jgi:hypothetical protein
MPADSPGRPVTTRDICAGERLPARLPLTCLDTLSVPGGQGVAGSNPAVPTQSRGQVRLPGPASECLTERLQVSSGATTGQILVQGL